MDLLDAQGQKVGDSKSLKISRLLDVNKKIFEGPVVAKFYNDRVAAQAQCYHCASIIYFTIRLNTSEASQADSDMNFRKNLFDLCCDGLQEDHQCGLLHDGKDNVEDIWAQMDKR